MFRSFGFDLKGGRADAQTPKEAIFHSGTRAHAKVIMKGSFSTFKYKLASFFFPALDFHTILLSVIQFHAIHSSHFSLFDRTWCQFTYIMSHYSHYTNETLTPPLCHCCATLSSEEIKVCGKLICLTSLFLQKSEPHLYSDTCALFWIILNQEM